MEAGEDVCMGVAASISRRFASRGLAPIDRFVQFLKKNTDFFEEKKSALEKIFDLNVELKRELRNMSEEKKKMNHEKKTTTTGSKNLTGVFRAEQITEIDVEFQKLKDAVVLSHKKEEASKAVIVTAEAHGDGATTVAVNLALTLARDTKSKVLLIDGDMRRPALQSIFSLGDGYGFSEVVLGEADPDRVVQTTGFDNVWVLPRGTTTTHLTQFNLEKLDEVLIKLKKSYNYIIFNSSPVNRYSDAVVLASHLDAAIIVMRAEGTRWDDLQRAKNQLIQKGVNILGVVMNRRKYFIPSFIYKRFI